MAFLRDAEWLWEMMKRKGQQGMRTVHVPVDRKNPYQRALGLALVRLGMRVRRQPFRWNVMKLARGMDVLHIHWTSGVVDNPLWKVLVGFPWLAAQFALLRLSGRRVVWTVHNLESHENRHPLQSRVGSMLIGLFANVVIVHGASARAAVARRFKVAPRKIAVIPHGNYLGFYPNSCGREAGRERFGLESGAKVLLFLGHIRPYKGVENLIGCFRRSADARAVLIIAGRPLDQQIEARIYQLMRGDPRIRFFPGYVPGERIQEFMQAADAVVFPYKEVLTSGAVLLAMSFGKACIAPRLGCIGDVLDADGALLYDANRGGGLEAALAAALGSPARLRAMGRRNQEKARQWPWDRIAVATARAYQGVAPAAIELPASGSAGTSAGDSRVGGDPPRTTSERE